HLCYTSSPLLCSLSVPATSAIYTLSLHDALPISDGHSAELDRDRRSEDVIIRSDVEWMPQRLEGGLGDTFTLRGMGMDRSGDVLDRKSTRLNSSHQIISYAVFCLKKKNKTYKV